MEYCYGISHLRKIAAPSPGIGVEDRAPDDLPDQRV
jgi:hypothetical protein